MLRMAFLLLVVVGVLAVGVGAIFALGVVRLGMIQQPAEVAANPPAAPTSKPATLPATAPAVAVADDPNGTPAASSDPTNVAGDAKPNLPPAPAAVPVQRVLPQPIVLRGADAAMVGRNFKRLPEGDIGFWDRDKDYLAWAMTPEPGLYHVDITYSGTAETGGKFKVRIGDSDAPGTVVEATAEPGVGWGDFRTRRVGQLVLRGGRVSLHMAPEPGQSKTLMNFRRIELVPVGPGEKVTVAVHPNDLPPGREVVPADGPPTVTGLTLVEAATGKPIGALTTGMRVNVTSLPPFSVRAETAGATKSVQFLVNGRAETPPESAAPYSIAGDKGTEYTPWRPAPGTYTLTVIPFRELSGQGPSGKRHTIYFVVTGATTIELSAKSATRHDGDLQLEGQEPTITNWTSEKAWVDWMPTVAVGGKYKVELLCAFEPGQGGEMLFRAGDEKIVAKVATTGGAGEDYRWLEVGTVSLNAGKHRVAIKATSLTSGAALMKLRSVRLVPLTEPAAAD